MQNYTPDQIGMFVTTAARRRGEELLTQMSVSAASSSAAFTGDTKPLEGIEKAIRGESTSYGSELQRRLKRYAHAVGAKVKEHGTNRR